MPRPASELTSMTRRGAKLLTPSTIAGPRAASTAADGLLDAARSFALGTGGVADLAAPAAPRALHLTGGRRVWRRLVSRAQILVGLLHRARSSRSDVWDVRVL